MSVSLEDADDTAYVSIKPGETVTANHEGQFLMYCDWRNSQVTKCGVYPVAHLFDFAKAGPGKFTFEPVANFAISLEAALKKVAAASGSVEVEVTGDLAKRELPKVNKRAVDICTDSSRRSFIDASYSEAKTLAQISSSYVSSRGASDSLFRAYFKTNAATSVTRILNNVANENSGSRTWGEFVSFIIRTSTELGD